MCGSTVDIQFATAENCRRKKNKLECGTMPNVMAAQPNIGVAHCESSIIPFLFLVIGLRRKVWLTPAAGVPCSNAANIWERQEAEASKDRAKFGWPTASDVAAV